MNNALIKNAFLITCLVIIVGACSSKYTASFRNSSDYIAPETENVESEKVAESDDVEKINRAEPKAPKADELYASKKREIKPYVIPEVENLVKKYEQKAKEIEAREMSKKAERKAIKKEKKKLRKNIKKEIKEEIKTYKKKKRDFDADRKIYVGIIIGAAGIVVAILASGALGALAIIVGVGLIAWGLIEKGN